MFKGGVCLLPSYTFCMKKKIIPHIHFWLYLVIMIFLVTIATGVYVNQIIKANYSNPTILENGQLSGMHPRVTTEDRKPLNIPEEAISKGRTFRLPILMYHHVGYIPEINHSDPVRAGLTVSPENFQKQMALLSSLGYHSVSLEDIYLYSLEKKKLPQKPMAVTFDDGYDDVFIYAVPVLKKYGYVGSFGIITGRPGDQQGTNTYASWKAIEQAMFSGMEIICHTQNHFDGSNKKFTAEFIYSNLTACNTDLQNNLGLKNNHILIYPYGHYTTMYIEQAKKAGFNMALTVHEGSVLNLNNLMEMPRIRINGTENLEKFKEILNK